MRNTFEPVGRNRVIISIEGLIWPGNPKSWAMSIGAPIVVPFPESVPALHYVMCCNEYYTRVRLEDSSKKGIRVNYRHEVFRPSIWECPHGNHSKDESTVPTPLVETWLLANYTA